MLTLPLFYPQLPNFSVLLHLVFCPEACTPSFALRTRPSASFRHARSPSHPRCAAFHIPHSSPRLSNERTLRALPPPLESFLSLGQSTTPFRGRQIAGAKPVNENVIQDLHYHHRFWP